MAALVEQVGHGQARGTRADDRHGLARAGRGRHGMNGAALVTVFHDGALVFFDRDRVTRDVAAGAGRLAQGGADPARELRVSVRGDQPVHGQIPLALIDQVVPLGDQVVQRTARCHAADHHAGLAEGHAAVHAAGGLGLLLLAGEPDVKLVEIFNALQRRDIRAGLARVIHKSSDLAHDPALLTSSSAQRRMLRSVPVRRPGRAPPWKR